MLFDVIVFIAGLLVLIKGADWAVTNSSRLASWAGISPIIIGLTILAFGTSLPELAIGLFSVAESTPDISVGNIVGSNIVNIGFVLAIAAIISPLAVKLKTIMHQMPFMVVSTFFLIILANDMNFFGVNTLTLNWMDGAILLGIFGGFLAYVVHSAKEDKKAVSIGKQYVKKYKLEHEGFISSLKRRLRREKISKPAKYLSFITIGLLATVFGAHFVVDAASNIATGFGLSDAFIGLTIVAIGTSLPEIVTSVTAALKRQSDIAVGNIVGSNIFNITFILGLSALITPLAIAPSIVFFHMGIMLIFAMALLFFMTTHERVGKAEGLILFGGYMFYLAWVLMSL